jgi:hypothetical protein
MSDILQASWRLITQIPGTFWGVVAGSLFTIIGVGLTNRANARNLHSQLACPSRCRELICVCLPNACRSPCKSEGSTC